MLDCGGLSYMIYVDAPFDGMVYLAFIDGDADESFCCAGSSRMGHERAP